MMSVNEIMQEVVKMSHDDIKILIGIAELLPMNDELNNFLVAQINEEDTQRTIDMLDFRGIGAELYDGTDSQEHVNALCAEWDSRPSNEL